MKLQPSRKIEHQRELYCTDRFANHRLSRDDREFVDLASNDYLGLSQHPRVKEAAHRAIDSYGCGATASPVIVGHTSIHDRLTSRLAELKCTATALLFPSGYAANVGTISALVGADDAVFCDRLIHASLIDGCRLSGAKVRFFRHRDTEHLNKLLSRSSQRKYVISEGLFSMDGTIGPSTHLLDVCVENNATLIMDEAHSNGVLGQDGEGLITTNNVPTELELIQLGTLSKAFGSQGGFVAGTQSIIHRIQNLARSFLFSTSLSPVSVSAADEAIEICTTDPSLRERLQASLTMLREALALQGWELLGDASSPIVSVLVGSAKKAVDLADSLKQSGILAPAIRPPTVRSDACRVRLSLNSNLQSSDLDRIAQTFSELSQRTWD